MRPEFQDIVDEVSRLLSRQAVLEDREFNLVAFSPHVSHIDEVRQKSILERHSTPQVREWFEGFGIATSDAPVHTPASDDLEVLARLCLPARSHGVTYGYLWMLDEPAGIDPDRVPQAMVLAQRAGALLAQQSRAREGMADQLRDLLSADEEAVDRAATALEADGTMDRQVPIAAIELRLAASAALPLAPMNLWRLPRTVLAAADEDHTTLLVPLTRDGPGLPTLAHQAWEIATERVSPELRDDVVVGVGGVKPDLRQAHASGQEARLAAQVAERVTSLRPIAEWPELGVYRLLACGPERALADAVLDPAVVRLLEHPDPELRLTASTFLDAGGSVQRAATELQVHRQTIYHRVERIEQVTGLDLSRGDHRLVLHLGLTLAPALNHP